MPRSSAYVASIPRDCGTNTEGIRAAMRELRPVKAWPLSGDARMHSYQLSGVKPLPLDRFVACLEIAKPEEVVAITRAMVAAAGKSGSVSVYPSSSADVRCSTALDLAEAAAEALLALKRARSGGCLESRRIHDHVIGLNARARSAELAFEHGWGE